MDFKAKLGLLSAARGLARSRDVAPAPDPTNRLAQLIRPIETAHGELHRVVQRSMAPTLPPAEVLAVLGLDESLAQVEPSRLLFLDTETTGLSGGAGTLPFLVGLAFFEGAELVVEQLQLASPGRERPVLAALAERLEAASAVVSFNGRSFDWPLLKTRFVMNRLPVPEPAAHLDLLHATRRVLRHAHAEVRLATVERAVLGVRRVGDLEGAQVPAAWFDYLRTGRVAALGRVLEHNLQDLRSTAALLAWLGEAWASERPPSCEVALGLGEVAERTLDFGLARRRYELATGSLRPDTRLRALVGLGRVHRKTGAPARAAKAWEAAATVCPDFARLHLALARLYEHALRDCEAAARHAPLGRAAETPSSHERRLARLARKRQLLLSATSEVDDGWVTVGQSSVATRHR